MAVCLQIVYLFLSIYFAAGHSTQMVVYGNTEPELSYVVPPTNHFKVRFNTYSKIELLSTIKRELSPGQWNCLSKGCLDSIVRMGTKLRLHHQVIHQILLREVKTEKKNEMWFKVEGRLMRFSLLEFCSASGLNCIEDDFDLGPPDKVSIYDFLKTRSCNIGDLLDFFVKKPEASPKKIILAQWLIIEGVILPQRSDKEVREEFLSLACDIERFEYYAWGRESYLHTIDSLIKVCRNVNNGSDPSRGYNLFGFPMAFQVLI